MFLTHQLKFVLARLSEITSTVLPEEGSSRQRSKKEATEIEEENSKSPKRVVIVNAWSWNNTLLLWFFFLISSECLKPSITLSDHYISKLSSLVLPRTNENHHPTVPAISVITVMLVDGWGGGDKHRGSVICGISNGLEKPGAVLKGTYVNLRGENLFVKLYALNFLKPMRRN